MKKYDSYKDSGVKWLGEIPEHWKIRKLKWIFTEKKKVTNPTLNCGSISFGRVVYKDDEKIPEATKKSYQVLNKGEFLLNPLNLNYDLKSLRIALSEIDVVVSSGYIVLQNQIQIHKDYYKWLLHIYDILYMKTLGAGVRQTINFYDISESLLCLPRDEEQQAIAEFLDEKTTKIDHAISIKEKEIDLLKERRQILIQELVAGKKIWDGNKWTKPTKTKDSGVDWIGEIPEDWEVRKLKYLCRLQSGEIISPESFIDGEDGYPVFGGNGFRGYTDRYTNEGKHILIGRQGALCGNVNFADGKFFASEHAVVAYPLTKLNLDVLAEQIIMADFNRTSQSAAQPGISVAVVKNIKFPYTTINEQETIGKFIEKVNLKISKAISLKQQEIEKLKEYKTVLIDNVVTGKIKVC